LIALSASHRAWLSQQYDLHQSMLDEPYHL
jgi:hypothetical protein